MPRRPYLREDGQRVPCSAIALRSDPRRRYMTPPCGHWAVAEREMACKSGYENLPLLPACAKHMRYKAPPVMFEHWGG